MSTASANRGRYVLLTVLITFILILSVSATIPNFGIKRTSADRYTTYVSFGCNPTEVAVNPVTNMIYAADGQCNRFYVMNGTTDTVVAAMGLGEGPTGVAVNPNTNMIYVTNQGSNTVSVLNGTTNTVVETISVGTGPTGVAVNPSTNMIYVSEGGIGYDKLTVINGTTNTVVDNIPFGTIPSGVAVNPLTDTIYVGVGNQIGTAVSVINGTNDMVIANIRIGCGCMHPSGADIIAADPSTGLIYAANAENPLLSIINDSTNTVISTVTSQGQIWGLALNSNTNKIYLSGGYGQVHSVTIINGTNSHIVQTLSGFSVGLYGAVVDPVTNMIYVAGYGITVIDGGSSIPNPLTLVINSEDACGNMLNVGFGTTLYQNGKEIATGYMTVSYTISGGENYTVYVGNYAGWMFQYWQDTGSTNASRSVSITSNTTLIAIYNNPNVSSCNGSSSTTKSTLTTQSLSSSFTATSNSATSSHTTRSSNSTTSSSSTTTRSRSNTSTTNPTSSSSSPSTTGVSLIEDSAALAVGAVVVGGILTFVIRKPR